MRNEDRDVWRAKLDKGEFGDALRHVKVRTPMTALTVVPRPERHCIVATGGLAV